MLMKQLNGFFSMIPTREDKGTYGKKEKRTRKRKTGEREVSMLMAIEYK